LPLPDGHPHQQRGPMIWASPSGGVIDTSTLAH
jgi:hypothetical protein